MGLFSHPSTDPRCATIQDIKGSFCLIVMESTYRPVIFGEWLKIRRKTLDLTQAELAHRVGCSVHALRKIESGERRPSKQLAGLIANSVEIPPEERALFIRVARGELHLDRLASPHLEAHAASIPTSQVPATHRNIPAVPTQLIGRQQELAVLNQLLRDPNCRMVTLVGPGGIGKTRLAIEAASLHKDIYSDGACFVSLASINSPSFLVPSIAGELGVMFQGQIEPRLQLINYLRPRNMLLLLDNLEHLLDGIDLLAEILESAPGVKLLLTSRERLNLQGEWVFEIHGLPVPGSINVLDPEEYSAIALFIQSAERAQADFKFQLDDLESIIHICRAVEGMPLGIELAAAWVPVLSCREIAQEIDSSLDFLATSMRDVPERQRSLRAVFNHSWNLLSKAEREILSQLAVFQGCFSRQAAELVAGASLQSLHALVTKSLVRRTDDGCYDLHEVIRQYALAHLDQLPSKSSVYDRHSDYYLSFLSDQERELKSHAQRESLQELSAEIDNLHAAWAYAVRHARFDTIRPAIRSFGSLCDIRGWLNEGINYLDLAIQELRAHSEFEHQSIVLGQALAQQGLLYFRQGKFHHAQSVLEESLSLLSPIGNPSLLTDPLIISAIILFLDGEIEQSLLRMDEGLICSRAAGDLSFEAYAVFNKGYIAGLLGNHKQAYQQMRSGLAMWRTLGDPHSIALGLNYISPTAIKLGLFDQAEAYLQESLALCTQVGDQWGLGTAYRHLGLLALASGDCDQARSDIQQSLEIFSEFITGWDVARSMIYLGETAVAARDLPEAEQTYLEVIPITMQAKAWPLLLDALVGLADVYAHTGELERACKLAAYVISNHASTQEAKDRASQLIIKSELGLPAWQSQNARQSAENQSMEDLLVDVLGEKFVPQ